MRTRPTRSGSVSLSGPGLQATGGNRGENGASGGEITILSFDDVAVNAFIDASNGDCISCGINIDALEGNITTTQPLHVRARPRRA